MSEEVPKRQPNSGRSLRSRLTPQSLDLEQATLGAMLMDRRAVARALEIVGDGDFYRDLHKKIFRVIARLFGQGEPTDFVFVGEELRRIGQLEEVGGSEYLSALLESCPSSESVDSYAKVVQEKSLLRQLIQVSEQIMGMAYGDADDEGQGSEVLAQAQQLVMGMGQRGRGGCVSLDSLLLTSFESLMRQLENRGEVPGVRTGFPDLDRIISGLPRTGLVIVGARPKMGKSSFASQVAAHIGEKERLPVAIFSLEMSSDLVMERIICSRAGVDSQDYRRGWIDDRSKGRVAETFESLRGIPLFIDDARNITAFEIGARARRLAMEKGQLGGVIVDYLQLVQGANLKAPRHEQVQQVGRAFSTLAAELKCPVVGLSQVSRACEQREDKRPVLSDLRESGALEAEAHLVMFLYRDGYYARYRPGRLPGEEVQDNTAEIIVAANRTGPTGTAELGWQGRFVRFTNLTHESPQGR